MEDERNRRKIVIRTKKFDLDMQQQGYWHLVGLKEWRGKVARRKEGQMSTVNGEEEKEYRV
jgi:hypothetical protein